MSGMYGGTGRYLDNLKVNWQSVYAQDPCGGSPPDLCKLILGGHGEMWGEVRSRTQASMRARTHAHTQHRADTGSGKMIRCRRRRRRRGGAAVAQ